MDQGKLWVPSVGAFFLNVVAGACAARAGSGKPARMGFADSPSWPYEYVLRSVVLIVSIRGSVHVTLLGGEKQGLRELSLAARGASALVWGIRKIRYCLPELLTPSSWRTTSLLPGGAIGPNHIEPR